MVYVNGENDSSEILHTASGQLRQTDSIILSGPWQHDASRPLKLSWTAAPPKEVATIYFSLNQTGRIFDGLKFDLGAPWTSVAVLATGHEGSGGAYLGRIPYSFVGMPIHFELVCRTNDSLFNSIPQTIHVY